MVGRARECAYGWGRIPPPPPPPESWLLLEQTMTAARFVHIHADTEPVAEQIATVFPTPIAPNVQTMPMTLRAIFLALAKSGRTPATPS